MQPTFRSTLTCKRTGFARGLTPVSHFLSLTWSHFILGGDYLFICKEAGSQYMVTKVPEILQVTKGGYKSVGYDFYL